MMTPDQAVDFIGKMDSGYYGIVADRQISEAFRNISEMLEEFQSISSDVLYYGMAKCEHCNHYTMPEEVVCHVCGHPLPVENKESEGDPDA